MKIKYVLLGLVGIVFLYMLVPITSILIDQNCEGERDQYGRCGMATCITIISFIVGSGITIITVLLFIYGLQDCEMFKDNKKE